MSRPFPVRRPERGKADRTVRPSSCTGGAVSPPFPAVRPGVASQFRRRCGAFGGPGRTAWHGGHSALQLGRHSRRRGFLPLLRRRFVLRVLPAAAAAILASAFVARGFAQNAAPAPSSARWLIAHARLPGPLRSGRTLSPSLRVTETWTPAHGGADPADRAQVLFFDSVELEAPLTRHGRLLNLHQAAAVNRQLAKIRRLIHAAWRGPQDDGRLLIVSGHVLSAAALLRRFHWRSLGTAAYHGHPCRRFAFTPRRHLRISSRTARVMAAMAGTLCADPVTGLVFRVRFHNQSPVRFGWGILGDFRGIRGAFSLQHLDGRWTWARTVVHLQGRELWLNKSGTLVKRYRLSRGPRLATPLQPRVRP